MTNLLKHYNNENKHNETVAAALVIGFAVGGVVSGLFFSFLTYVICH